MADQLTDDQISEFKGGFQPIRQGCRWWVYFIPSQLDILSSPIDRLQQLRWPPSQDNFGSSAPLALFQVAARKNNRKKRIVILFTMWLHMITLVNWFFQIVGLIRRKALRQRYSIYKLERTRYIDRLVNGGDNNCIEQLRMNVSTFNKLCFIFKTKGYLRSTKHMNVIEQVAIFLYILGHHSKNRIVKFNFERSGESISRHFHKVLNAVLRLQGDFFRNPKPIEEDSTDEKWKCFKNCLGALDGTHIRMNVPTEDKPRYQNRKSEITTNVLGVCSPNMQFLYVLPGWEGSAVDGRILKDALLRKNGLVIPKDAGYTNGEGFLAPYKGQRYHLNDWKDGQQPTSAEEYFNMKHSSARNVIERCFGILNKRWAILRSPSFYPIKIQNRIILACCILHNYIRAEMPNDPFESGLEDEENGAEMNQWKKISQLLAVRMSGQLLGTTLLKRFLMIRGM